MFHDVIFEEHPFESYHSFYYGQFWLEVGGWVSSPSRLAKLPRGVVMDESCIETWSNLRLVGFAINILYEFVRRLSLHQSASSAPASDGRASGDCETGLRQPPRCGFTCLICNNQCVRPGDEWHRHHRCIEHSRRG